MPQTTTGSLGTAGVYNGENMAILDLIEILKEGINVKYASRLTILYCDCDWLSIKIYEQYEQHEKALIKRGH